MGKPTIEEYNQRFNDFEDSDKQVMCEMYQIVAIIYTLCAILFGLMLYN